MTHCRKTLQIFLLCIIPIMLCTSIAYGLDKIGILAPPNTNFTAELPGLQSFRVQAFSADGKTERLYKYRLKVLTDGSLRMEQEGPDYEGFFLFNRSLVFQKRESHFLSPAFIKQAGGDRLTVEPDPVRNKRIARTYKGEKLAQTKEYPIFPGAYHFQVLGVLLQAMLGRNGEVSFCGDVDIGTMKVNVDFGLIRTADPLGISVEYRFPERFRELVRFKEAVYVYVIKVNGPLGLVYPHKFYYVYEAAAPHRILAYWGGPPKETEFLVYQPCGCGEK